MYLNLKHVTRFTSTKAPVSRIRQEIVAIRVKLSRCDLRVACELGTLLSSELHRDQRCRGILRDSPSPDRSEIISSLRSLGGCAKYGSKFTVSQYIYIIDCGGQTVHVKNELLLKALQAFLQSGETRLSWQSRPRNTELDRTQPEGRHNIPTN
jgi:hypothetical protein